MHCQYFSKQGHFEEIGLTEKIEVFLTKLEKRFGSRLIEEIFVVECRDHEIAPIYCYQENNSGNERDVFESCVRRLYHNAGVFYHEFIDKGRMGDNRGAIIESEYGELFDAVLRLGSYCIFLNNPQYTFKALQKERGVSREGFVEELQAFYESVKTHTLCDL